MNEITQIHLGRQPFTISVAAHRELQTYLDAIKKQVGASHKEVIEEVEIRMAELLAERGVTADKVVLSEDIAFLKEQLGTPADFKEEDSKTEGENGAETAAPRRLFRDTQTAMLGGVSAGIAAYFTIDAVIVRLLFVIATFAGGWGILLYIVMWLIVPEAKTSSDRLQMRGKAVTVDSLKEAVGRADVTGAAHRASRSVVTVIEAGLKVLLILAGVCVVLAGVVLLVGLGVAGAYASLHDGHIVRGIFEFPLGVSESVALAAGLAVLATIAIFMLAVGAGMVRRKWMIPGWGVGAIIGIFLIGLVVGGAALPDTIERVHNRYNALHHVEQRRVANFTDIEVLNAGDNIDFRYEWSEAYKVELRYIGDVDTRGIKTSVKDAVLTVDATGFNPRGDFTCDGVCIHPGDIFEVVVYAPRPPKELRDGGKYFAPPENYHLDVQQSSI